MQTLADAMMTVGDEFEEILHNNRHKGGDGTRNTELFLCALGSRFHSTNKLSLYFICGQNCHDTKGVTDGTLSNERPTHIMYI